MGQEGGGFGVKKFPVSINVSWIRFPADIRYFGPRQ